ncbi:PREDICTED: uncharacterized protein LOC109591489 [Amphimedon queenslandica]|uniref:Uncharacterized protein n=1 Tax=Amphimedon queenslandica TaxID=400682 RepID=A0AAN0K0I4_AMPQE|nr:PREDICTED: uncharacterized protein LOC109591489 [Amphimedon queenslandica]|eukprot:XP_019862774.1 PREDICTED: uncharacterized protein LOC109591489 [Amphimedon queenslandica]
MSGIWSSELASRLPGTPVRLQSGVGAISPVKEIIHDQPRSGGTASVTKKRNKTTSPLCSEMDQHLTELDLLLELKMLSEDPVPGVFLLPSTKSLLGEKYSPFPHVLFPSDSLVTFF